MRRLRAWFLRLRALFNPSAHEQDFSSEIESHLHLHIADNVRSGMSPQHARREALIKLGGVEQTKELRHDRSPLLFLDALAQDFRLGLRSLMKSRVVAFVCILILALGIGASTSLYSVWKAALTFPHDFENNGR